MCQAATTGTPNEDGHLKTERQTDVDKPNMI